MKKSGSADSKSAATQLIIGGALALVLGLSAIFLLHLVTTWLRASSIWSIILPITLAGAMVMVGAIVGRMAKDVPISYVLLILLVLACEVSWYWWDYRDFRSRVTEKAVAAQMADAPNAVDRLLIEETGSPGFWGYVKWSANQGATIEGDPIPAGKGATFVNWGKRLLSLFWAVLWAFVGLFNA